MRIITEIREAFNPEAAAIPRETLYHLALRVYKLGTELGSRGEYMPTVVKVITVMLDWSCTASEAVEILRGNDEDFLKMPSKLDS